MNSNCMAIIMRWLIALTFLAMFAVTHAGTLYKSVDSNGKIVYSDQPPTAGKIEKTLIFTNLPATPMPESVIRYREELQKGIQKRLSALEKPFDKNQITLFAAQWCRYCQQAKAYLSEKKIHYREYDIDTAEGKQALVEAGVSGGIPILIRDGKKTQGFSKEAYDALFSASP